MIWLLMLFMSYSSIHSQLDLWEMRKNYTVINETDELMDVSWVSGGGQESVSGKMGGFTLSGLKSGTITANNKDCIALAVQGKTFNKKASLASVCEPTIYIRYKGDLKDRLLTLVAQ